ncbi:MAG: hypothetical protein KC457_35545, partial [Myxococcales bacterium]|nr:hypothetical protein [Myxococcales bacterium]
MSDALARVKQLAEGAQERYLALETAASAGVVRWEWADFDLVSFRPAFFEIGRYARGKRLSAEPRPPVSGAVGYGFDEQGRIIVERHQVEFPGQYEDVFHVYEPGWITSLRYAYGADKRWMNVDGYRLGPHGVVEWAGVSSYDVSHYARSDEG